MTLVLWIAAFLGVAVIYLGDKAVKLVTKKDVSANMEMLIKGIGTVISAAAMIILYTTGRLI